MRIFTIMLQRELLLAYRQRTELVNPLVFFLIIISLFPLGISPDPNLLRTIAPGIIWIAVLLATLLSLDRLFRREADDGMLEQWLLTPHFNSLIFCKMFAHWLVTGLPLILLAPLLAIWLQMPVHGLWILLFSLSLGTPALSFIGAIFSALTVQLRHSGLLLALLVLPFYIPILIFATSAVTNATSDLPVAGQLAFLGAVLTLTVTLAPLATAAALKVGMH